MVRRRQHNPLSSAYLVFLLPFATVAQLLPIVDDPASNHQIYVIHVDRHEMHDMLGDEELESFHRSFLPNTTLDYGLPRLVYSYRHVISGFAARLTPNELDVVRSMPGFRSAERDRVHHLETTYTPEYLGLTKQNGWGGTAMGNGIVMGIIDSGIKPSHPSFSDYNIPPTPPTWKGNCTTQGSGFVCNNKIVAGKAFRAGTNPSPVDDDGHGTHVAGIAAGRQVTRASVLGMAYGVASGMAPKAHLAIYKVCYQSSCNGTDIYAGIDQAIKDGVDVINMSLGGSPDYKFYEDSVALGSLAAIQHGIVAVASAGNKGPDTYQLSHSAPWVLTVGAATTNRRVTSTVELNDGRTFEGQSAYQPANTFNSSKFYPLESPTRNSSIDITSYCVPQSLSNMNFRGQIVMCRAKLIQKEALKGKEVFGAGGEGMIIMNLLQQGYTTFSDAHVIPASHVNYRDGLDILDYYLQNKNNATATLHFRGTEFGSMSTPTVGSLSSRGPSRMNGGLIKPDVIAPGINILSASPVDVGPNPDPLATHTFNFESGTSMATAHVSGIAALIKSKHRGLTPAEIVSAIITTAEDSNPTTGKLITEDILNGPAEIDTMGAGLVRPVKALDPGLVYGVELEDYVRYLCGLGYTDNEMNKTLGTNTTCNGVKPLSAPELNYPSIVAILPQGIATFTVSRKAKNVGNEQELYHANIMEPEGVSVYLSTYKLQFTRSNEVIPFEITITPKRPSSQRIGTVTRGKLVWDSGTHLVTSPIAVRFI